jgi:hypothetical protein
MVTRSLCLLLLLALSASAQTPRIPPPEAVNRNGLVGSWLVTGFIRTSGNAASSVLDFSGRNAATPLSPPPISNPFGRPAILLNTNYFSLGTPAALSMTNAMSMCGWVLINTNLNVLCPLLSDATASGAHGQYNASVLVTRKISAHWGNGSSSADWVTTNPAVEYGKWQHIAITRSDKMVWTIYVNATERAGSWSAGGQSTPIYSSPVGISIGRYGVLNDSSLFMRGHLSDVRLYNRALTAAEIAAIYRGVQ